MTAPMRWVLVRHDRTTAEPAFYRCYAPGPVTRARLVAVAGRRWQVEESFHQGKGPAGLDEPRCGRGPPGTGGACRPWPPTRS